MSETNRFWKVTGKLLLSLAIAFIATIVITTVMIILMAVMNVVTPEELMTADMKTNPMVSFISMTIQGICFVGAAAIMYLSFERKKGWPFGLKQDRIVKQTVLGMGWGVLLISLCFAAIWLTGGIAVTSVAWNEPQVWSSLGWSLALFAVVAVSEEIFSRGYIQGLLTYHYGNKPAIIVSSLLFALIHSFNPAVWDSAMPIINLFLAGVLLAVCRYATGGLWMPIGIHLTWNFFQGNVFGFKVSGNEVDSVLLIEPTGASLLSGGDFGAEGSVVTSVLMVLGTYLFARWFGARMPEAGGIDSRP